VPSLQGQVSAFAGGLTALFVEDDAATRAMVAAELRGVFKELILAPDGAQGLAAFRARRPQLVLTDNRMPVLTGLAMTERIRAEDAKVPVIFMTAAMDTDLLVRAINLGISAFIAKPILRGNLRHALGMVVATLENEYLQRRTLEQDVALLQFRERYHEYQQGLAFRKEMSLLENDFLDRSFTGAGRGEWLAQVRYHPHDIMCGDSYALRRLPDGSMLVFLADAMGKGLAASLTTALAVSTFNLEVDRLTPDAPFQLRGFVQRYLALMTRRLLEDEVLPMALAWLPAAGASLETAVFGLPPMLVGAPGQPVRKLRAGNPPVSVFTGSFETASHDLGAARSILLYSDGLNEAVGADGCLYRDHLDADFSASTGSDQFWAAFQARVAAPDDDVTLLLLQRVDGPTLWQWSRQLASRLEQIELACQAVERQLEACAGLETEAREEFSMAVREAMLNAYEHGSLGISPGGKRDLLEEGTYYQHLAEAVAAGAAGGTEPGPAVRGAERALTVGGRP
jgi:CheY-like chemotaxis protein